MLSKLSALVLLLLASTLTTMAAIDPLDAFEWQHRIVLAFDAEGAVDTFNEYQEGIDERHIIWFALDSGQTQAVTNFEGELPENFGDLLRARYHEAPEGKTEIVLIGKDGGVKSRDPALDLKKIFARIDAMPMRQAEMKEQ